MRIIRLKNNTQTADYWVGVEILPGEYYQLQNDTDLNLAINEAKVNQDIWSSPPKLIVNDGIIDLDPASGDKWLKGINVIEVLTQAEKNDKDKLLCKAKATVSPNTSKYIFIKCPGTMNLDGNGNPIPCPANDRFVNGGTIICNNAEEGDFIELFVSSDNDPINPTLVKPFTEAEENSDEKNGWYMDWVLGSMDLSSAAPAHMYKGFYLVIKYNAVSGGTARKVYVNIDWDKKEF